MVAFPFNSFMLSGFFFLNSLDRSISYIRDVWLVCIFIIFVKISKPNAKSAVPQNAVTGLGLKGSPISFL